MALLNPSPALTLPAAMWVTFRAVVHAGPLTREDLLALTSPPGIRPVKDGERRPTDSAKGALDALLDLRLVAVGADEKLAPSVVPLVTYASFCAALRSTILGDCPMVPPLDESRTNDLLRALSWLLTTDPMGQPWSESTAALERVPEQQTKVFINPTRWNGFRFWVVALGFSVEWDPTEEGRGSRLVADPTRALRDFVAGRYTSGETVTAARLLQEFRDAVPVLPGGSVSRALGYEMASNEVDRATAYALENARERGWLVVERQADFADTVLLPELDRSGVRPISHVTVQEGKHA